MVSIVELAPVLPDAGTRDAAIVQGIWNSREQTADLARAHGHTYWRPSEGQVSWPELDAALGGADVLVLAPIAAAAGGIRQPMDGAEAGRTIGHRLLDGLSAERPELHVVLVSHFLVGRGVAHRNAKRQTWGLRTLEAHLRAGRNPYTILRPTWLSTVHDAPFQNRLAGDQHADGLVSTYSVAAAVLAAVEHPTATLGRTAAIYNLGNPGDRDGGPDGLAAQFLALEPDSETTQALQSVGT